MDVERQPLVKCWSEGHQCDELYLKNKNFQLEGKPNLPKNPNQKHLTLQNQQTPIVPTLQCSVPTLHNEAKT